MNSPVSQAAEFPASTQSVLREPAPLPASKKVWHNPMMVPLRPVASRHRWFLGFCFFVLFFALWALVTFTGLVSPTFLASPASMLQEGGLLFTDFDFTTDIGMTVMRVLGGFILACIIAVPLGILMGSYKLIEAFFEPFVSFCRYLPASAFVPLLILWAGIGEMQKILVIFIGSFFQITLMVRRVIIPGAAPEIAELLRLVLGWAWTYVIVAELIGSSSGIGHMIVNSQALLNTGQMIFGIIVIGCIGLLSDLLFKAVNRRLFVWSSL